MFTAILSGHLTAEPILAVYGENAALNFTLAVNFNTGKKDGNGNYIDETIFYQCTKWQKGTDEPKILEHLKKGKKIIVEANKITAYHNNKDGTDYVNISVQVHKIELC
ncbi:single-stranded DNA-binding protein [Riemerella anatipestifer]|nr:single-stranded DNA-binding protein [Riemerella anatipestifer]